MFAIVGVGRAGRVFTDVEHLDVSKFGSLTVWYLHDDKVCELHTFNVYKIDSAGV